MNTGNTNMPTITQQTNQLLMDGVKKVLDSEEFANYCKKTSKLFFNNYSANNALLVYLQNPNASYVMGYEEWKKYGRQVTQNNHGEHKAIRILKPVYYKNYPGVRDSLFTSINKSCSKQLATTNVEFAKYTLSGSNISFTLSRNGLYDVSLNNKPILTHATAIQTRNFVNQNIVGKVPSSYCAVNVFDIADTTDEVEYLWVKDNYTSDEVVRDAEGNVITNKKGQVQIINSDKRRNKLKVDLDMKVASANEEHMEILYSCLCKISSDNGVIISEASAKTDATLTDGALGYFQRGNAENNGKIIIDSDLDITNKVAVAFHEIAHSRMHVDYAKLKDDMGVDKDTVITRQMKETQAEGVALMTASFFGIETETKSFQYIANWSSGRELNELKQSLNVIYNESSKLLNSVKSELEERGLSLSFEALDLNPLSKEEKDEIVKETKLNIITNMRINDATQASALAELKDVDNENLKVIVSEQVATTKQINDLLKRYDALVGKYESTDDRTEQIFLEEKFKAIENNVSTCKAKIDTLGEEINSLIYEKNNETLKLREAFTKAPKKFMESLKEKYPEEMASFSKADMKFLSTSRYVAQNYGKYLDADMKTFITLCEKQVENFHSATSKNGVTVEFERCEDWGDGPLVEPGTLAHPKTANEIMAKAEKKVRKLKKAAEKEGGYYPYHKCSVSIYSVNAKGVLSSIKTRVDIGDGQQTDLTDYLKGLDGLTKKAESILETYIEATEEALKEPVSIEAVTAENIDGQNLNKQSIEERE